VLKYALKTEELLAGNKDAHPDMAYVAGLLFDILVLLAQELASDKKKAVAYIDHVYTHGVRTAQIGVELAKSLPDFAYSRYVFSSCLVHDVGKCLLAILSPEYLPYIDEAGKRNLPRAVRHFAEAQRFGIHHAMLGSLVCNAYQMLRPVERAILFHHEPFHLKSGNKNLFQLCSLICLATNMANYYKRVEKSDDPVLGYWRGPELKDFRIDTQSILATVQRVGA
jgi:HD-like signal output (HDOD) protein